MRPRNLPPITMEHHPGPRARRAWRWLGALLAFLLAPRADLSTHRRDAP